MPDGFYYTLNPYAPGAKSAGDAPNGRPYGGYTAPNTGTGQAGYQYNANPTQAPPTAAN